MVGEVKISSVRGLQLRMPAQGRQRCQPNQKMLCANQLFVGMPGKNLFYATITNPNQWSFFFFLYWDFNWDFGQM